MKTIKGANVEEIIKDLVAGKKVHYNKTYGKGRYGSLVSYKSKILSIFRKEILEFGNDAPRGGKTGEWVKIK